eukprot:3958380-Lingulodinium_polyedra.AAC.1
MAAATSRQTSGPRAAGASASWPSAAAQRSRQHRRRSPAPEYTIGHWSRPPDPASRGSGKTT